VPARDRPGQPHRDDCSRYKRPIVQATIGSFHDWEPEAEPEDAGPELPVKKYMPLTKKAVHKVYASIKTGPQYQAKLSAMQAQAYNHEMMWLAKRDTTPSAFVASLRRTTGVVDMDGEQIAVASLIGASVECNCDGPPHHRFTAMEHAASCPARPKCNCAAASGVIGHAAFCLLGDGTGPETV
jgi:hypothetical protein